MCFVMVGMSCRFACAMDFETMGIRENACLDFRYLITGYAEVIVTG